MSRISHITLAIVAIIAIDTCSSTNHVPPQEWKAYKDLYNKDYTNSGTTEAQAKFYYEYNKNLIIKHNALYDRGLRTYSLSINQFTDMRLIHFNAQFPVAKGLSYTNASPPPPVGVPPASYNPLTNFGFSFNIEDQGSKCNSGWAYAAAKCIEMLQAEQTGDITPLSLSAQHFIDCSGRATACKSQVPQTAYDYLTQYNIGLLTEGEYHNNNTLAEPGMCVAKGSTFTRLAQYATFQSGDDLSLKAYVGAGFPVVIEVNPTSFDFMHYGEGVYQPPKTSASGSHFMVVVGYERDTTTGLDYWILHNSFGKRWGENGLMRMLRSSRSTLAKNSIFPSMLA